jgi:serine/threonine protein kinase
MARGDLIKGKKVQNKKENKITTTTTKAIRNPFKRGGSLISDRQLKGFQIVKRIGSGVSGKVFIASKKNNGKDSDRMRVAMKMVDASKDGLAEFVFESELCEQLSAISTIGPRFQKAWRMRADGKTIGVMVTDLWDTTLERYMDKNKLKTLPRLVTDIVSRQITQLHQLGFVHLDIHAGNVLLKLDQRGKPKDATLADFGNAMELDAVDGDFLKEVIEWFEIPKTKDPKKVDKSLYSLMKREWK